MAIEFDSYLPPLNPKVPPAVPVETLVTVGAVTLMAGDVPAGILREFYTQWLGLVFISGNDKELQFSFLTRRVTLSREREEAGRLGLLIRGFDEAIIRLREGSVPVEVLHSDGGMSRVGLLKDPVGNWIQLLELRPF